MYKIKHFIDGSIMHDPKQKQQFEDALQLKGCNSHRYVPLCLWYEVVVDAGSECDKALRHLVTYSRKEP